MKIEFAGISGLRGALIATVTAVALFAGQLVVLVHDRSPDSHAPDSVCEFCIAGADLSAADVGKLRTFTPTRVSDRVPETTHRVVSASPLRHHFARAPPTAS